MGTTDGPTLMEASGLAQHAESTIATRLRRHPVFLMCCAPMMACGRPDLDAMRAQDLTGTMAALESNLSAIHERDAEAYLAHYLDSPQFVVATAGGIEQGFYWFAEARRASEQWPDTFITERPTFRWIAPGVVWGAFAYTSVEDGDTTRGVSERLFVKTERGWKIAVTGSMEQ